MKPFNLKNAEAGEPVCLRDGRRAKILDFDFDGNLLVKIINGEDESSRYACAKEYTVVGEPFLDEGMNELDKYLEMLMMAPKTSFMRVLKNNDTGLLEGDTVETSFNRVKYDASMPINKTLFSYAKVIFIDEEGDEL